MRKLPLYQAPDQLLDQRVILITGAGQGIGKELALRCAALGATVILCGRTVSKLIQVYDDIMVASCPEPVIWELDLEKVTSDEADRYVFNIRNQLGRLDGLVHNAACFDHLSLLKNQTEKQLQRMLQVNTVAPFLLTRSCWPLLTQAREASVIFTSTRAAQQPLPYWGWHAISKNALQTMALIWAQENDNAPHVRMNVVVPGPVQSPQRVKSHPGEMPQETPDIATLIPAYLYLLGSDSHGVNGQVFDLAGC